MPWGDSGSDSQDRAEYGDVDARCVCVCGGMRATHTVDGCVMCACVEVLNVSCVRVWRY